MERSREWLLVSQILNNGKQAREASIVLVNQVIVLRGYENFHNTEAKTVFVSVQNLSNG
jgi:hypothetical protein